MNPLSIAVGQVTIIVIGLVLGFYFQRQRGIPAARGIL